MATAKKGAKGARPAAKTPAAKKPAAVKSESDPAVFAALRGILARHAPSLAVVHDAPDNYYLDTRTKGPNGKPLFFGAARAGKGYVSFYLMPVYAEPDLLDGVSPALRARMQGKSCFNFKAHDPALLDELAALTARSFERWKAGGRIG